MMRARLGGGAAEALFALCRASRMRAAARLDSSSLFIGALRGRPSLPGIHPISSLLGTPRTKEKNEAPLGRWDGMPRSVHCRRIAAVIARSALLTRAGDAGRLFLPLRA
jgi:hypothetical protein